MEENGSDIRERKKKPEKKKKPERKRKKKPEREREEIPGTVVQFVSIVNKKYANSDRRTYRRKESIK